MRKVSICLSVALLLFTLTACGKTQAEEIQDTDGTPTQVATQQPEEPTISKETGQPSDPVLQDISVSVAEAGGGHTFELEKTDAETISQILSADSWVADSTDCLSDYIVTLDGRTIYYHSDCGTFNERLEQSHQSLHLSETDRATVNDIIRAVISNEPGSARPVTIYYGGHFYSYDGYITYDLPDGFDFIGETNNVGNSSKAENFAANEDGYLYKSIENDELIYFQWKDRDESVDGGEEPYLLLYRKEQYDDPTKPVTEQNYHIINIFDRTRTEGLPYDMAEEKFFEDSDNEYYFSGIYSHYVIVHYEDGSREDIVTALNAGRATIADLDKFEVYYIVRALDTENIKPSDKTISQTEAEEIALTECKVNDDYIKTEFDVDKNAWEIGFWEDNAQIASQTILIDTVGKVLNVGYAE